MVVNFIKEDRKYRLLSLQTGTYLTRAGSDNALIVGNQLIEVNRQAWVFHEVEGTGVNMYTIKSAEFDQWLGVPEVRAGHQLMCINTPHFIWRVSQVADMALVVRLTPQVDQSLFADLWGGGPGDDTIIGLHPTSGNNQLWVLVEIQD